MLRGWTIPIILVRGYKRKQNIEFHPILFHLKKNIVEDLGEFV